DPRNDAVRRSPASEPLSTRFSASDAALTQPEPGAGADEPPGLTARVSPGFGCPEGPAARWSSRLSPAAEEASHVFRDSRGRRIRSRRRAPASAETILPRGVELITNSGHVPGGRQRFRYRVPPRACRAVDPPGCARCTRYVVEFFHPCVPPRADRGASRVPTGEPLHRWSRAARG